MKRTITTLAFIFVMMFAVQFVKAGVAGPDQTICARPDSIYMAATGTGAWSALSFNPSITHIHNSTDPNTYISGFTVPGVYGFIWSGDTILVTVKPIPATPVLTERGNYCLGHDTLIVHGAANATNIEWLDDGWVMYNSVGADSIYVPTVNWGGPFYYVSITGPNGCTSLNSDSVSVLSCGPAGPNQTICPYFQATMAATGTGTWTALPGNPDPLTTIWSPNSPTSQIGPFYVSGTYRFKWGTAAGDTISIYALPEVYTGVLTLIGSCLGHDSILLHGAAGADSIVWMLHGHTVAETPARDSFYAPTVAGTYEAIAITGSFYHQCPYFYGDSVDVTSCCSVHDSISYVQLHDSTYSFTAHSSGFTYPIYHWYNTFTNTVYTTATIQTTLPAGHTEPLILLMTDSVTGCIASDTLYINITCNLTAYYTQLSYPTYKTVTVNASGGSGNYYYEWTGYASYQSAPNIANIYENGIYQIVVTDLTTGCIITLTDTVTSLICNVRDSVSYTDLGGGQYLFIAHTTGATDPTYDWNYNGYVHSDSIIFNWAPGYHDVILSITDSSTGCYITPDTILVFVPSGCTISASVSKSTNFINDETFTATPSGGTGPYTYHWSNGSTHAIDTVTIRGIYSCTVTDHNGCTAVVTDTTDGYGFLSCGLYDTVTYVNLGSGNYRFTAHPTGGMPITYNWYVFGATYVSGSDSVVTYHLPAGATYQVQCYTYDAVIGCDYMDSNIYIHVPSTTCHVSDSISYYNIGYGQYQFTAHGAGFTHPSYSWFTSFSSPHYTTSTATYTLPLSTTSAILLYMTDSVTGCEARDTIYITTACSGHDSISYVDDGGHYTFTANTINITDPAYTWVVPNFHLINTGYYNYVTNSLSPGIHSVTSQIYDTLTGCSYSDSIIINVPAAQCHIHDSIGYISLGAGLYQIHAYVTGIVSPSFTWHTPYGFIASDSISAQVYLPAGLHIIITLDILDSATGCTAHDTLYINTTTGINTLTDENNISLYPNPNNGSFILLSSHAIGDEYTVYDMIGRAVAQQNITSDKQTIVLKDLPTGTYILKVKGMSEKALKFTVNPNQ